MSRTNDNRPDVAPIPAPLKLGIQTPPAGQADGIIFADGFESGNVD